MTYIITKWRRAREGEGWEPDVPGEPDGFGVLFSSRLSCPYCILSVSYPDHAPTELKALGVAEDSKPLLASVENYLPAIARVNYRLDRECQAKSSEDFQHLVVRLIREELERQPHDRAMLVESLVDEVGYRMKGEFVWALSLNEETGRVTWVCDDGELYVDPMEGFRLSPEAISRLKK